MHSYFDPFAKSEPHVTGAFCAQKETVDQMTPFSQMIRRWEDDSMRYTMRSH
ncbi:MAG: hypothetical protein LZF62_50355 [Nitrospira sp.]|nr:MAG: hypothetical protein LZF62_50355 [Nitrospira sp.]